MLEPKFITEEAYTTKSQRYDELLEEAVGLIQKFSGNQWTDYNYHDPGITILEQLCFAITDLGYKTNFPIEDILLIKQDNFDIEKSNLFFPPHKIFPTKPVTINDFRKLIIDNISNIQNAWLIPKKSNLFGLYGIFSVKVQLIDNLDENHIKKTIAETKNLLMDNRSLATDFEEINVLNKDIISFKGNIVIDSFIVGEEVLAQVYNAIESKINEKLIFYDIYEMEQEGHLLEDLYAGTHTRRGYISSENLKDKTHEIYISDIKQIINSVEGVYGIEDFEVLKNGIKIFDDLISFDANSYPALENIQIYFSDNSNSSLHFYRNGSKYEIDQVIFFQVYDSISIKNRGIYQKKQEVEDTLKKGRFTEGDMKKYYSIMRELPAIYNLRENELSSNADNERRAQVKQLKAYLLLFEQIMSNHLSQLSNMRNFFSIDSLTPATYYNQVPYDVPNIKEVIKNENIVEYEKLLSKISESKTKFYERKNKVLDHMLSRFGESFNTELLLKLEQVGYAPEESKSSINSALKAKTNYAKNILELGRDRNHGFNYKKKISQNNNLSGIEKRIKLCLHITKDNTQSFLSNFDGKSNLIQTDINWKITDIQIKNGPKIPIITLPNSSYTQDEVIFNIDSIESFRHLFLNAFKNKSYRIEQVDENYITLYNSPNQNNLVKIYESKSFSDSKKIILKTIKKFKNLNVLGEGFFMIENILLRQKSVKSYVLEIYDGDDEIILESGSQENQNELRDIRNDLFALIKNKNNFAIQKEPNNNTFKVVVYDILNKPILETPKSYSSEKNAEKAIKNITNLFESKIRAGKIEDFTKIKFDKKTSNNFPENFKYSNQITFIFPDWPFRFQNKEFVDFTDKNIKEFIPSHIGYDTYFLNIEQIKHFETIYNGWLENIEVGNIPATESLSLQLIQLLINYKKNHEE